MELETGWQKLWFDIEEAGILPGVTRENYPQRYAENRAALREFLASIRSPVLSGEQMVEVHRRLFGNLTPWAGDWARPQAFIGGRAGAPHYRCERELALCALQTRHLLREIDPRDLNALGRVAAFQHARLLAIHPFPDGNGRTTRVITEHFYRRGAGLVKSVHPNKEAYVSALVQAIDTHNLAPLARHFQWELTGRAEALAYVVSPFRIPPRQVPSEAGPEGELRVSRREEDERLIATTALPSRRSWLYDARLDALGVTGATANATAFGKARELLEEARPQAMTLGEAVAVLSEVHNLQPYTTGVLRQDIGVKPYQRWARQEVFAPVLCALSAESACDLGAAIDAQLAGEGSAVRTTLRLDTARSSPFCPPAEINRQLFRGQQQQAQLLSPSSSDPDTRKQAPELSL